MMKKGMIFTAFLFCVSLFSACAGPNTVINRSYDFDKVKRIGVMKFESPNKVVDGADDIFGAALMGLGYNVVERVKLNEVIKETKIGAEGFLKPDTTKQLGEVMGVDVLLVGEVSSYVPGKQSVNTMETQNVYTEPVYIKVKHKNPDGSYSESLKQTGTKYRKETNKVPVMNETAPQVSIIAKLVDVETAEIVWVGSYMTSGTTAFEAMQSAVQSLASKFGKDVESLKKK
jgi:curli biogenesis system outer membrane secretion channel CsgG